MTEHHTNPERILFHAVKQAYWLCHEDRQDDAYVVLTIALDAYTPHT